jgi:hypothetical protein
MPHLAEVDLSPILRGVSGRRVNALMAALSSASETLSQVADDPKFVEAAGFAIRSGLDRLSDFVRGSDQQRQQMIDRARLSPAFAPVGSLLARIMSEPHEASQTAVVLALSDADVPDFKIPRLAHIVGHALRDPRRLISALYSEPRPDDWLSDADLAELAQNRHR